MCHQSGGNLSTAEDPPDVAVPVSANQLHPCATISCSMNHFYCSLFFHPIIEQMAPQSTAAIISGSGLLDILSALSFIGPSENRKPFLVPSNTCHLPKLPSVQAIPSQLPHENQPPGQSVPRTSPELKDSWQSSAPVPCGLLPGLLQSFLPASLPSPYSSPSLPSDFPSNNASSPPIYLCQSCCPRISQTEGNSF